MFLDGSKPPNQPMPYCFRTLAGAAVLLAILRVCHAVEISTATVRILPIEEFIQLAAARDTEFEAILIDRFSLAYEKDRRLPAGDLVTQVKAQHNFFLDPNRDGTEFSAGLSRLFPFTGTRLSADYSVVPSAAGGPDHSALSLSLAQPIAENAFGWSTRLLDRIVGLEIEIALYQIVEAYEDYLAVLMAAYYAWYEAYENMKIGQSAYRSNLQLLENMRSRQQNRIALPIDVNKVRLQVLAKQETLLDLTERHKSRLNVIERAVREELGDRVIPAPPEIESIPEDFRGDAHKDFRKNSRTYETLNMLEKRSSLNMERETNELLPSIDALIGYELEGEGYGLERRERLAKLGIQLKWPIPDAQAQAERETAKIELRRTKLQNENTRYRLDTRLRTLALQIHREKELIDIADKKIKLAAAVLEDESENYSFGRVTLNDYIAAVNSLDSSRFNKIAHEVFLRQLVLEVRRLTDVLVANNEVGNWGREPE